MNKIDDQSALNWIIQLAEDSMDEETLELFNIALKNYTKALCKAMRGENVRLREALDKIVNHPATTTTLYDCLKIAKQALEGGNDE